ncbi:MAG: thioesterase domain-containing protein [Mycobacteriales bacterium]
MLVGDTRGCAYCGQEETAALAVALFGHSLGAVLAYELCRRLAAIPGVEVARLNSEWFARAVDSADAARHRPSIRRVLPPYGNIYAPWGIRAIANC